MLSCMVCVLVLSAADGPCEAPDKFTKQTMAYFDAKAEYDAWNRLYLAHKLLQEAATSGPQERERVEMRAVERAKEAAELYPGTAAADKAEKFITTKGSLALDTAPPRPVMPDSLQELLAKIAKLENHRWTLHEKALRRYQKEIQEERQRLLDRKTNRNLGKPGAAKGEPLPGSNAGGGAKPPAKTAANIRDLTTRLNFLYSTLNEGINADRVWVRSKQNGDQVTPGFFAAK